MVSYTGDVTPGGPPDTRELDSLTITKVAVDEKMSNNCYLLTCKHTGEQVLIDAADASATLMPLIGDAGLTHVLTTHQHWDHHRALADVVGATSAATVAGVPDAAAITEQTGVPIALEVVQGDTVPVGDCTLEVIALAGHTPGSIALLYDDPPRAATRTSSPATRCSPAASATPSATPTPSPSSSTRCPPRSSTSSPTTRGSTPATATTRPSAPSARTWASGASGAGDPGLTSTGPLVLHLNGPPGVGKSTLARRWAEQHPGTLLLDPDALRTWVSGWRDDFVATGARIRPVALAMLSAYVADGGSVVLAQLIANEGELARFEAAARDAGGRFVEVFLEADDLAERFVVAASRTSRGSKRSTSWSRSSGRPPEQYADRLAALSEARPDAVRLPTRTGDVEGSYAALVAAVG